MKIDGAKWELDAFDCLSLRLLTPDGPVHAWIQQRPMYCDRGHFQLNIEAPFVTGLDSQDGFPRYYMNLTTAMEEAESFLAWRIYKILLNQRGAALMQSKHESRAMDFAKLLNSNVSTK